MYLVHDALGHGAQMATAAALDDDNVVRKVALLGDVEDHRIEALLLAQDLYHVG
jgi:hypothetical protein